MSGDRQLFTKVGIYKSIRVAIKKSSDAKIELNRDQLLELKNMKELSNDHLVKFYGACLDSPHSCILTEYCPKGSLQDILENDQVKLDRIFRMSLIHDLIRGMQYLHHSDIKSHGTLKSSNCVVDSRFVLKISDFGLHFLRAHDESRNEEDFSYWQSKLCILITRALIARVARSAKMAIKFVGIIKDAVCERFEALRADLFRVVPPRFVFTSACHLKADYYFC